MRDRECAEITGNKNVTPKMVAAAVPIAMHVAKPTQEGTKTKHIDVFECVEKLKSKLEDEVLTPIRKMPSIIPFLRHVFLIHGVCFSEQGDAGRPIPDIQVGHLDLRWRLYAMRRVGEGIGLQYLCQRFKIRMCLFWKQEIHTMPSIDSAALLYKAELAEKRKLTVRGVECPLADRRIR